MKPRRLLFDAELLLDVLFDRSEDETVPRLWARVELGAVEGLVTADAVSLIHAAASEARGAAHALRLIRELLRVFQVARVDQEVVDRALELARKDFALALLVVAARTARCHGVVTARAPQPQLGVACLTPAEALAALR